MLTLVVCQVYVHTSVVSGISVCEQISWSISDHDEGVGTLNTCPTSQLVPFVKRTNKTGFQFQRKLFFTYIYTTSKVISNSPNQTHLPTTGRDQQRGRGSPRGRRALEVIEDYQLLDASQQPNGVRRREDGCILQLVPKCLRRSYRYRISGFLLCLLYLTMLLLRAGAWKKRAAPPFRAGRAGRHGGPRAYLRVG